MKRIVILHSVSVQKAGHLLHIDAMSHGLFATIVCIGILIVTLISMLGVNPGHLCRAMTRR